MEYDFENLRAELPSMRTNMLKYGVTFFYSRINLEMLF